MGVPFVVTVTGIIRSFGLQSQEWNKDDYLDRLVTDHFFLTALVLIVWQVATRLDLDFGGWYKDEALILAFLFLMISQHAKFL